MERLRGRCLVSVGDNNNLVGIVPQTSILTTLAPMVTQNAIARAPKGEFIRYEVNVQGIQGRIMDKHMRDPAQSHQRVIHNI